MIFLNKSATIASIFSLKIRTSPTNTTNKFLHFSKTLIFTAFPYSTDKSQLFIFICISTKKGTYKDAFIHLFNYHFCINPFRITLLIFSYCAIPPCIIRNFLKINFRLFRIINITSINTMAPCI